MSVPIVDTDVIVRLATGDNPLKQASASALFTRVAAGNLTLAAPVSVIADAVFVLSSPNLYALERQQVAQALDALVRLPHFHVEQRGDVLRALDLFAATRLDFSDALLVAAVERTGAPILYSYDRDFDRILTVTRKEP